MTHDEIREILDPYVDRELDLISVRKIEQHLRSCDDCRGMEQQLRALREALAAAAPAYSVPSHLRRNIRAALRREARTTESVFSPWLVFATGAVCAALLLGFVFFQTNRGSRGNEIVSQVVANHVRSLLATHLVDVISSDQHTVKPWFDGKVDFAPDVHDFSMSGFPLVGGRLDYLDGKTVVALVYQRNKHPINVFVMPATNSSNSPPISFDLRGYNVLSWTQRGMNYWAVSDLNQTELRELVGLIMR
jgi:anti-sigma factor RsiW